jgi:hypothetical protein
MRDMSATRVPTSTADAPPSARIALFLILLRFPGGHRGE